MDKTLTIKAIQRRLGLAADGIIGPKTLTALSNALRVNLDELATKGCPTQAEVRSGKSIYGKPGDEDALVSIVPPYQLYYEGKPVKTIRVHNIIAQAVKSALMDVRIYYGEEEIKRLGLDQYSGSYNFRKTTGGGAYSMHAWGIALDFAAETNAYNMHKPEATLSRPECNRWWEIWESYGAVSLGRERDVDWMHLQFAKL